jgi:[ribosomal protein S5]-alanine N-acetyltransferase
MRPFSDQDVELAFAWFGDPEVMRYTRGPDPGIDATRERIAGYRDQQDRLGFSKWLVLDKRTNAPIGDAGLLFLSEVGPLPELGYRLMRSRWGRGLGSEIANAWVSTAFDVLGLTGVSAFAHLDNGASHRVLEKAGFACTGRRTIMGTESDTFVRFKD